MNYEPEKRTEIQAARYECKGCDDLHLIEEMATPEYCHKCYKKLDTCPVCKSKVEFTESQEDKICMSCGMVYHPEIFNEFNSPHVYNAELQAICGSCKSLITKNQFYLEEGKMYLQMDCCCGNQILKTLKFN